MKRKTQIPTLMVLGLGAIAAGCDGSAGSTEAGGGAVPVSSYHYSADTPIQLNLKDFRSYATGSGIRQSATAVGVDDKTVDYGLALRTASIKLRGNLPSLDELNKLKTAIAANLHDGSQGDPAKVYADLVDAYMNSPAFSGQMVQFWRNTLRTGSSTLTGKFQRTTTDKQVPLDTAPVFMAKLTVEKADITRAFTEPTGACPTFNAATNTFTAGNCFISGGSGLTTAGNNVPEGQQAGVLTNPAFQAQWYSNMGFRRARLIQELFACRKMPAEFRDQPEQRGPYLYSSPWPFDSVPSAANPPSLVASGRVYRGAGAVPNTEFVDFLAQCQSCHSSMNHRASMFATFDQVGYSSMPEWTAAGPFMVVSPVSFSPYTQVQEYLRPGDTPAWKYQKPASTFQAFGKSMAADAEVQRCFVNRAWNWVYSRDDIVEQGALVPPQVTEESYQYFKANNFNFRATIQKMVTDGNFVRF